MLRSKSTLAVLLALSFFFDRAQAFWWDKHVLIGFTVLSEDQAKLVNKDNKLSFVQEDQAELLNEGNEPDGEDSLDSPRLGLGLYLVNEPGGLPDEDDDDDDDDDDDEREEKKGGNWYCAVAANERKMGDIGKVFIPKSLEKSTSDGGKAKEIDEGWQPTSWSQTTPKERQELWGADEEVIVDYIKSMGVVSKPKKAVRFAINWQWQMLIPTKVVNGGDLDLWANCYESEEDLVEEFSTEAIDWKSAFEIKGDRTTDWRHWTWS
ncbi:uncharacterized protein L3040_001004 [Drepanopeziza brunnea f. sp. 'multigermtubi']|uniref:Uncharacterized protein n=1 Tax=Marssonina brunnea f. sp. multigermtubi (strain MB_m1) TaxID=1072389 RepID=K1WHP5_MARBU|nr:uncharacterized protein MBM_09430 [Drepanopeziza brunnea f. sp. 'multigermtubi' MB_m1]EKD12396.1 hypothetical protein MBM_09430 [Drepanopeziza brunnea f. sp. 'multigermtubi' MB_m1]KAJ5054738.1 hypothetical protein L3040_001004 [Drepanopeziza brunnea f. sp. 'multigermtubi']